MATAAASARLHPRRPQRGSKKSVGSAEFFQMHFGGEFVPAKQLANVEASGR
jgi:hypothetical protein